MPGIASSSPAVLLAHLAAGDVDHPGRLGRRDAAQPRAAGRGRAVRDARGAAPRPGRPRHRSGARAPTRSPPAPCAGPAPRCGRGRFPAAAGRAVRLLRRRLPRRPPLPPRSTAMPGLGYQPGPLAARVERLQRPRRPASSGCRSRSPTTSPPSGTRDRASPRTAPRSGRRTDLAEPYVDARASPWCAPTPTSRRAGWPAPGALAFLRLRQGRPGRLPDAGGGGRVPASRRRRRSSCSRGPRRTSSAVPTGAARAARARRAHRRRRADDHDHGATTTPSGSAPTS